MTTPNADYPAPCRHLVVTRWRAWLICVDCGRLLTYDGVWT